MEKSANQIEKNVSASFAYVKKDMLMLNDAFSDLHDKMQHLSLNHAMLLEEMGKLRHEMAKASGKAPAKKVEAKAPAKKAEKKVKKPAKKAEKKVKKPAKKAVKKKPIKKVVEKTTVYS